MRNSSSPSPFLLFVPLSSPLLTSSLSVLPLTLSLPVLSNSSRPRAVLKSFLQTLQISFTIYLSLPPSFFLSTLGPLPFAEKKPKANRKLMKSENVVAFSLLYFCYVFFFSFLFFLLRFVVVVVGFAQLQNIFWSLTFSFAHFFRCLPACCCCFFCVLFVFHFLKFRLLLFFLLPPPPF